MLTIAYYFLQVLVCSGIMVGYYWLVLRNRRFHQYNRFYLLAITLLAWIVPLIKIRWSKPPEIDTARMIQFLSVLADNNSAMEESIGKSGFQWNNNLLIGGLYLTVTAAFLFAMIRALVRLYRLLQKHSCRSVGEVYLVLTQAAGTPFSFFRYIFWNEEIDIRSEAGRQILQHELTHVKQKHSVDKIFMQLVLAAGWFNPFFWLIRKEMEMIHEFIADKKAVADGDTAALANMLLTAAYPQQQFSLANPFFFSPIKRRLQMLTNNTNPRFSYIRRLVVLPLIAIVVVLFAFRNKEKYVTLSMATMMEDVINKVKGGEETPANLVTIIDQANLEKRYTVVIDAGHGGQDKGSVAEDGTTESSIVLSVARMVKQFNSSDKIDIILTREEDTRMGAVDIVNRVNQVQADLYVSIHCEKSGKPSVSGMQLFVPNKAKASEYQKSVAAANYLTRSLGGLQKKMLGISFRQNGSWILDNVNTTAVLIETGFLTNTADLTSLKTDAYQRKLAAAILSGINGYLLAAEQDKLKPAEALSAEALLRDTLPARIGLSKAMIFVDGQQIAYEKLASVSPADIDHIQVLKGKDAVALYGKPGENGVVLISTKQTLSIRLDTGVVLRDYGVRPAIAAVNIRAKHVSDSLHWLSRTWEELQLEPNKPVITVDGVRYYNRLSQIDPADIASISIIKDQAAIARYGSEGRNGVIDIITKKNPTEGAPVRLEGITTLTNIAPPKVSGVITGGTFSGTISAATVKGTLMASTTPLEQVVVTGYPGFAGRNDNPPSFPGGLSAWANYLADHLNTGVIGANGGPRGKYTVSVFFVVLKDGTVRDIRAENDPGFGTAAEAVRVITHSGKWEPGERNGAATHMSHRVSISFYTK
ncbi:N-acetylmuramoyl-L-alanine amidase [Sediminibacterium soli]|uniref:N-acetylmuramoyl-L-alanine amidase n=1 Tax=Sediminibacterium soli TaxID=2698829 RepID=UPI00137A9487|nr:N-acetylmuramoyl-L-alanine amidase [Sediminibacterium soli]NCI48111.1 TonB-dependent receptor plug domain-containing protein [Sediminibacterium soli]